MSYDKASVRRVLDAVKARAATALTPAESDGFCARHTEFRCRTRRLGDFGASEAARVAGEIGFPVVMKIVSPDILHKTEAGGVMVGVKSAAEAEQAYERSCASATAYKADAKIDGVSDPADAHRRARR